MINKSKMKNLKNLLATTSLVAAASLSVIQTSWAADVTIGDAAAPNFYGAAEATPAVFTSGNGLGAAMVAADKLITDGNSVDPAYVNVDAAIAFEIGNATNKVLNLLISANSSVTAIAANADITSIKFLGGNTFSLNEAAQNFQMAGGVNFNGQAATLKFEGAGSTLTGNITSGKRVVAADGTVTATVDGLAAGAAVARAGTLDVAANWTMVGDMFNIATVKYTAAKSLTVQGDIKRTTAGALTTVSFNGLAGKFIVDKNNARLEASFTNTVDTATIEVNAGHAATIEGSVGDNTGNFIITDIKAGGAGSTSLTIEGKGGKIHSNVTLGDAKSFLKIGGNTTDDIAFKVSGADMVTGNLELTGGKKITATKGVAGDFGVVGNRLESFKISATGGTDIANPIQTKKFTISGASAVGTKNEIKGAVTTTADNDASIKGTNEFSAGATFGKGLEITGGTHTFKTAASSVDKKITFTAVGTLEFAHDFEVGKGAVVGDNVIVMGNNNSTVRFNSAGKTWTTNVTANNTGIIELKDGTVSGNFGADGARINEFKIIAGGAGHVISGNAYINTLYPAAATNVIITPATAAKTIKIGTIDTKGIAAATTTITVDSAQVTTMEVNSIKDTTPGGAGAGQAKFSLAGAAAGTLTFKPLVEGDFNGVENITLGAGETLVLDTSKVKSGGADLTSATPFVMPAGALIIAGGAVNRGTVEIAANSHVRYQATIGAANRISAFTVKNGGSFFTDSELKVTTLTLEANSKFTTSADVTTTAALPIATGASLIVKDAKLDVGGGNAVVLTGTGSIEVDSTGGAAEISRPITAAGAGDGTVSFVKPNANNLTVTGATVGIDAGGGAGGGNAIGELKLVGSQTLPQINVAKTTVSALPTGTATATEITLAAGANSVLGEVKGYTHNGDAQVTLKAGGVRTHAITKLKDGVNLEYQAGASVFNIAAAGASDVDGLKGVVFKNAANEFNVTAGAGVTAAAPLVINASFTPTAAGDGLMVSKGNIRYTGNIGGTNAIAKFTVGDNSTVEYAPSAGGNTFKAAIVQIGAAANSKFIVNNTEGSHTMVGTIGAGGGAGAEGDLIIKGGQKTTLTGGITVDIRNIEIDGQLETSENIASAGSVKFFATSSDNSSLKLASTKLLSSKTIATEKNGVGVVDLAANHDLSAVTVGAAGKSIQAINSTSGAAFTLGDGVGGKSDYYTSFTTSAPGTGIIRVEQNAKLITGSIGTNEKRYSLVDLGATNKVANDFKIEGAVYTNQLKITKLADGRTLSLQKGIVGDTLTIDAPDGTSNKSVKVFIPEGEMFNIAVSTGLTGNGELSLRKRSGLLEKDIGSANAELAKVDMANSDVEIKSNVYAKEIDAVGSARIKFVGNSTLGSTDKAAVGIDLSNVRDIDVGSYAVTLNGPLKLHGSNVFSFTASGNDSGYINVNKNLILEGGLTLKLTGQDESDISYKVIRSDLTPTVRDVKVRGTEDLIQWGAFVEGNNVILKSTGVKSGAQSAADVMSDIKAAGKALPLELQGERFERALTPFNELYGKADKKSKVREAGREIAAITDPVEKAKELFKMATHDQAKAASGSVTGAVKQAADAAFSASFDTIGTRLAYNDSAKRKSGMAAGGEENKFGGWTKLIGSKANQKEYKGDAGFKSSLAGIVGGSDTRINDSLVGGLMGGYTGSTVKMKGINNGDKVHAKTLMIGAYGSYDFGNNFFSEVVTMVANTAVNSKETRTITNDSTVDAKSKYDVMSFAGKVGLGYNFAMMTDVMLTPMASLSYVKNIEGSYTQTGAGNRNRTVHKKDYHTLFAKVGAKLAMTQDLGGYMVTPEVHGFINHDLKKKGVKTQFTYDGLPGNLTTEPGKTAPTSYSAGFSLGTDYGNTNLSIGYDAEVKSKYLAHHATLALRVKI